MPRHNQQKVTPLLFAPGKELSDNILSSDELLRRYRASEGKEHPVSAKSFRTGERYNGVPVYYDPDTKHRFVREEDVELYSRSKNDTNIDDLRQSQRIFNEAEEQKRLQQALADEQVRNENTKEYESMRQRYLLDHPIETMVKNSQAMYDKYGSDWQSKSPYGMALGTDRDAVDILYATPAWSTASTLNTVNSLQDYNRGHHTEYVWDKEQQRVVPVESQYTGKNLATDLALQWGVPMAGKLISKGVSRVLANRAAKAAVSAAPEVEMATASRLVPEARMSGGAGIYRDFNPYVESPSSLTRRVYITPEVRETSVFSEELMARSKKGARGRKPKTPKPIATPSVPEEHPVVSTTPPVPDDAVSRAQAIVNGTSQEASAVPVTPVNPVTPSTPPPTSTPSTPATTPASTPAATAAGAVDDAATVAPTTNYPSTNPVTRQPPSEVPAGTNAAEGAQAAEATTDSKGFWNRVRHSPKFLGTKLNNFRKGHPKIFWWGAGLTGAAVLGGTWYWGMSYGNSTNVQNQEFNSGGPGNKDQSTQKADSGSIKVVPLEQPDTIINLLEQQISD